jgi:hypothetical protein
MNNVLLIHPPIAKPGEPPAGIARLKGILTKHNIGCSLIDANLESIHYLLHRNIQTKDRWTANAYKNVDRHINDLNNYSAFKTIDHYNRIVKDLNRILYFHGRKYNYNLGLADCTHNKLSPLRSHDLIQCAEKPENNPFYEYYTSIIVPAIEKHAPDIIGLSINFLSQALCSFALIGLIRKAFPKIKICIGGGLLTSWMRNSIWKDQFNGLVDYCIQGPGEHFFISKFKKDKSPVHYAPPVYDDLSELKYLSPNFVLPYNTSIGCYWKQCSFCPELAEGNPFIQIPHQQVIDDLISLTKRTKPSLIHFLDNALSPSFLNRFFKQPLGVPWYGYVRFTEHLTDLDFCKQIKKSGCVMLKLGLESGDQNVLDKMKKGINLKTASKILHNLSKIDIPVFIYLLFGTPFESKSEAKMTMNFIIKHHKIIRFINSAIFNMPISSNETTLFPVRPFFQGDLSLYVDFEHPLGWDRLKVRHFLDRIFKRHSEIATILCRTPKIFTSNHAPFFNIK